MEQGLPYAQSYRDLLAYNKSLCLAAMIFKETKSFPKDEIYSLTSQIRRSSRSIGAQIAEAWGKRKYKKHFVSKLTDASSEINETEHWIVIAYQCEYISIETRIDLLDQCLELSKLVFGMITKATLFCEQTPE